MQVYLSKSNLACPYLVDKVRQIILDRGYKVAEHHNLDKYNHSLLLESDALVIVPAKEVLSASYPYKSNLSESCLADPRHGYYIGKGQYEQLKAFMDYNKKDTVYPADMTSIMCVEGLVQNGTSDLDVNIGRLHSLDHKINGDWKVSYAFAELRSPYLSLQSALIEACPPIGTGEGITIPGFHGYSPERGVYPLPGYEKEIAALKSSKEEHSATEKSFIKKADTIIRIERGEMSDFDKKLAEVRGFHDPSRAKGVRSECFDGVPHLACRMLYNL